MNRAFVALALVVLAACGRAPEPPPEKPTIFWDCGIDREFAAVPTAGGFDVYLPGRAEPFLAEEVDATGCEPKEWGGPWQAARERGATMRAVGQEPGWLLELTDGAEILLGLDYGARVVSVSTPPATPLGGARGYHAEVDGMALLVLVEDLPCFDIMSGEVFPETVTVQLGEVRYSGCGLTF